MKTLIARAAVVAGLSAAALFGVQAPASAAAVIVGYYETESQCKYVGEYYYRYNPTWKGWYCAYGHGAQGPKWHLMAML